MKLFSIALLLCLSALSSALYAGQFNSVISIGDPLPGFSQLPATDGQLYSSEDFNTDVLVLVTLSNVCPFSTASEGDVIKLVEQFKTESVAIVGINYNINKGDKMPAMQERARDHHFNFVYLRDESQNLGRQLGTTVTPEFFVFNKHRQLVYTGLLHNSPAMQQSETSIVYLRGEPSEFYVSDAIRATLAGHSPATAETRSYGCSVEYVNK